MRRRSSASRVSTEEASGLAGWLYTDLLLGLAVVFLGTVTFSAVTKEETIVVPSTTSTTTTTPAITTTTVEPDVPTFQLSCDQFYIGSDILRDSTSNQDLSAKVTQAINSEIERRGWTSKTARVGFVLLFGGFDSGPNEGAQKAAEFQRRIQMLVPLLASVEMSTSGSTQKTYEGTPYRVGGKGNYAMLIFFAYQGDPAQSGCA